MDLKSKDWSTTWIRRSVGTPLRLSLSISSVVLFLLYFHFRSNFGVREGLNWPAIILGWMVILAFLAMRGLFMRIQRQEKIEK